MQYYSLIMMCGPLLLVGCSSGNGFNYVPVSGTVTINGEPARNVVVIFRPLSAEDAVNTGGPSRDMTDANGKFSLRSSVGSGQPGAVAGNHIVYIHGLESTNPEETANLSKEELPPEIPEKYSSGGLPFVVPEGGTDAANIDLIID
ncbi:transthyretin-like family protein [Calycomorphotria hydatis]|nr:hypothetical protein [Calycomorphotria hydatis]